MAISNWQWQWKWQWECFLKLDLIEIITRINFLFSAIFNILDLCRWHSREFFLPIENISSCPDRLKQIATK